MEIVNKDGVEPESWACGTACGINCAVGCVGTLVLSIVFIASASYAWKWL